MKTVDCIGLYCPEPVFRARRAMEEAKVGDVIEILADDPAAESDIPVLVKKLGQELVEFEKGEDGVLRFVVKIVKEVR
ncbi:MAG: sulfurtransferase TusA family protein [Archaeoglobaceae archaeon]